MSDHIVDALKTALLLLGGGGGWKVLTMVREAIKGWRSKGDRQLAHDAEQDRVAIDITEQLRGLARDAVADVRKEIDIVRQELATERVKTTRLTSRVGQLERVLHDNHLEVPPEIVPQA